MEIIMKTYEELVKDLESCVEAFNKAINDKDAALERSLTKQLDDTNKLVKKAAVMEEFQKCSTSGNAFLTAVTDMTVHFMKARIKKDKGVATEAEVVDDASFIDLRALYTHLNGGGLGSGRPVWADELNELEQLLVAKYLFRENHSAAQIEILLGGMRNVKSLIDIKKALDDGETPLSGTQLTKHLQAVIDQILFIPGDENKAVNKIRVRKQDVEDIYASGLKPYKAINTSKDAATWRDFVGSSKLMEVILVRMNAILLNKEIRIKFKTMKDVDLADLYTRAMKPDDVPQIAASTMVVNVKTGEVSTPAKVSAPTETKVTRKPKSKQKPAEVSTPAEV